MVEDDDWNDGEELLPMLHGAADTSRLAGQDAGVAQAADAAAARLRPSRRWTLPAWPVALAAGLAAGVIVSPLTTSPPEATLAAAPGSGLTLPGDVLRSGGATGGAPVAVAEAAPELWYRYIQELIYRGDFALAEQHLHAFNQLHPDYRAER